MMEKILILIFILILVLALYFVFRIRIVTEIPSPFKEKGKVVLKTRMRRIKYRGEYFKYLDYYLKDKAAKKTFTVTSLEDIWLSQVYAQYRVKHNIPDRHTFKSMRESFGLTYEEMESECNLQPGQWKEYEEGKIPELQDWERIRKFRDEKLASLL